MFDVLAKYLKEKASLTDYELEEVKAAMTEKMFRKNQFLLQPGELSNFNCFVAKGCLRLYNVGADGTEHILRFAIENWWMSDYESYQTENPSRNYIDALEDTQLLIISKADFDNLLKRIPKLKEFVDLLNARSFTASQNRILSTISGSAEERYGNFVKSYPDIFSRVPLRMIASYLGVTRETLSRIRSK